MEILKSIRKDIIKLYYYTAGKSPQAKGGRKIKLSSNENPLGSSPLALKAMEEELKNAVNLYPDSKMRLLREAVVTFWKKKGIEIKETELLFGDASGEIINMLLSAFVTDGDNVIISEKSFSLYTLLSVSKGASLIEVKRKDYCVDLDGIAEAVKKADKPKMVIFSNPDNPTSTFKNRDEIKAFLDKIPPATAVLLDEAYIHFAGLENSAISFLNEYPNLILAYTFSKAYGLAGLRVGYAVLNEKIAEQLEKIRLPFNLGLLQQKGAAAALNDEDFLDRTLNVVEAGKAFLCGELDKLGIRYLKPYGNFIFADFGGNSAQIMKHIEESGITLRPLASFGFSDNFVRISVGTQVDNQYLIDKIKEGLDKRQFQKP